MLRRTSHLDPPTSMPWSLKLYIRTLTAAENSIHHNLAKNDRLAWSIPQARTPFPHTKAPWMLAHAASGGDVRALRSTLAWVRQQAPHLRIYLSAVTTTGYAAGLEAIAQGWVDAVTAAPLEMPTRWSNLWSTPPYAAIVERLEFWPAMLTTLAKQQIPWVLHNGRISARSTSMYRAMALPWWHWLLAPMTQGLMLNQDSVDRLKHLTLYPERIAIAPSSKITAIHPPSPEAVEALRAHYHLPPGRATLVAGSIHEGELDKVLVGWKGLRPLVIAPRYPEHVPKFVAYLKTQGIASATTTQLSNSSPTPNTTVRIVDRFGELPALYGVASWSLLGGTSIPLGGHNPLEAFAAGSSLIVGPYTDAITTLLEPFHAIGGVIPHAQGPGWPTSEPPDPQKLTAQLESFARQAGSRLGQTVVEALKIA